MPKVKNTCSVCGKTYEMCVTAARGGSVFRWQEVACSPECGAEYLRRVRISRGQIPDDTQNSTVPPMQETAEPITDNAEKIVVVEETEDPDFFNDGSEDSDEFGNDDLAE